MSNNHKGEPGNRATILTGSHKGLTGKVLDFFQEKDDTGIPVEGGLKGHTLAVDGVGKLAFWSGEIRIHR